MAWHLAVQTGTNRTSEQMEIHTITGKPGRAACGKDQLLFLWERKLCTFPQPKLQYQSIPNVD